MLADLQVFYRKYLDGELGGDTTKEPCEEVPCESTFCDNFDTGWFSSDIYTLQFNENFEEQWFTNNTFINEYVEGFDTEWFTDNNYIIQNTEDFEGVDWDE